MKPTIVMQSDFGLDSGYVASMHGICKLIDQELEIKDSTHMLPAFDIESASFTLQYTLPYWPAGTIFVSVVDPGVGTRRRASIAKLKNGSYVVTPDNGTLTYLHDMIGVEEIREIDENKNRFESTRDVSVFHGRDLFSYCAAKLASGIISFEEVGPAYPIEEIELHPIYKSEVREGYATGKITGCDPFGSVNVAILNKDFNKTGFTHGDIVHITIEFEGKVLFEEKVTYHKAFAYVNIEENILFNDLASFLTLGINQGNFAEKYGIKKEEVYTITIKQ